MFRHYESVTVGKHRYKVAKHTFWKRHFPGWEPETFKVFQSYLTPASSYVDIGAWIGPTILFAHSLGAKRLYAVEANPPSFGQLVQTVVLNEDLKSRTHVANACISDRRGLVNFGSNVATSAASVRGDSFQVPSYTLEDYLTLHSIEDVGLVKIDIEGSEHRLGDGIEFAIRTYGCPVFLSLHPAFYPDRQPLIAFVESLSQFCQLFDCYDKPLTLERLLAMIRSEETHPDWGTPLGNFFEILLKPQY